MEPESPHRLGVVDCGTNTFTLHIADCDGHGGWNTAFRQKRFVRLGLDSFRSGRLSPQRIRRGLDVLSSFRETARNFNVDGVRVFGCSALRDAANGGAFVEAAKEIGWEIDVIDGSTEAHWIHLGVADSMGAAGPLPDALLTVDIGGGSVEFIHWTPNEVLGRWSLELGVARLTDWIKPSDPMMRADFDSIARIADAAMAPMMPALQERPPTWMVGTSGAFNTLMVMQDPGAAWGDPRRADEFDRAELLGRCAALSHLSKVELHGVEGMHPDRVPYMAVACALIDHILARVSSVERVFRSRHTLAEGVLVEGARACSNDEGIPTGWQAV